MGVMYECSDHSKGHRTEEARDACLAKAQRRLERKAKAKAEEERRLSNASNESVEDYCRRRYCRDGVQAVNVAAALNRDYPKRGKPYDWVDVVKVHAGHLNWPTDEQLRLWLQMHPDVLLPSEVRKLAGEESNEESRY